MCCEERGMTMHSRRPDYDFSSRREKQPHQLKVMLLVSIAMVIGMVVIPMLSVNLCDFRRGGTVYAEELDQRRSEWVDWNPRSLRGKVAHDLMPELDPSLQRDYR